MTFLDDYQWKLTLTQMISSSTIPSGPLSQGRGGTENCAACKLLVLGCVGDGIWQISAVNSSQTFHLIDGLKPGTLYTVRLMAKRLFDNASIYEDVFQTEVKGESREKYANTVNTERRFYTFYLLNNNKHITDKATLRVVYL